MVPGVELLGRGSVAKRKLWGRLPKLLSPETKTFSSRFPFHADNMTLLSSSLGGQYTTSWSWTRKLAGRGE